MRMSRHLKTIPNIIELITHTNTIKIVPPVVVGLTHQTAAKPNINPTNVLRGCFASLSNTVRIVITVLAL